MIGGWTWCGRTGTAAVAVVGLVLGSVGRAELVEDRAMTLPSETSAGRLLAASGAAGGLAVHIGSGEAAQFARLTAKLRADDRFVVHGLYRGPGDVEDVRGEIEKASGYGPVSAEAWPGDRLPYAENLVNVIVASDPGGLADEELDRVLAPGGVAIVRRGDRYVRLAKPRPETIDDWTHLLYDAGNNAVCNDRVVGPPHGLRWIAPPLNSRHHERLAAVSVVVSAGGKLFYIIDEAPAASVLLPSQWALVARDAFSGVVLWKRAIPRWEDHLRSFRSGPPELSRSLVATGDGVFVTLGQRAFVTALDPTSGETVREYPVTDGAEEILFQDGILYLATRHSTEGGKGAEGRRALMAVEAETGRVVWRLDDADPLPMSLAMADGRVVYMDVDGVRCLEAATGKELWATAREVASKRPGWSSPTVVLHDDVVLVADRWTEYKGRVDEVTGKEVAAWLAQEGWTGDLVAYSAETGEPLWDCRCAETYHAPPDVFVAGGLVWVGQSRSRTGPDFVAGRDLHTGEIKRRLKTNKAWDTTMPHHRCHRNRATPGYIIAGRTGVEFIDLVTGDSRRHHWTRGTCQFGILPSNGLLYVPPHACACYIEAKLTGFLAMSPKRDERSGDWLRTAENPPAEKGPGYGRETVDQSSFITHHSQEWPTYRRDRLRSAYIPQEIPAELGAVWESDLGGKITSPVIAGGKVFAATMDAHRVHALDAATGKPSWDFAAGGRVDSPPTVDGGRVIFGSADGYVYCLRASDGELAWRFRAAPEERRIMAFRQLESAWPVHGSVLVLDGNVYCVAGRSSYLDGGLVLYRLDAATGDVLARRAIYSRDPETGEQPDEPIMFEMAGALPDVLAGDGELVTMRHLAFDRETLESRQPGAHVYSPGGFLNGDWFHRTYWIDGSHFYSGYIGWYFAGREAPAGRLLAFTDAKLYGYGFTPKYYRGSTGREYHLFGLDRAAQEEQPPPDYRRANRDYPARGAGKFRVSYLWSQRAPLVVRGMVLTEGKLFAVGLPENALTRLDVFRGEEGARLAVVSTADGELLREYQLDALPAFDGMAAAGGNLFLSLDDGRLLCLGSEGKETSTFEAVEPLEERLPPLAIVEEPGLAGYWKLDEGEGNLARDSSGGGHMGKASGNWVTGGFGTCIRTDRTPSGVTIPDGRCLHPGTGDFTIQMWLALERHDCRLLGKEAFPRNWWVVNVLPNGRAELVLGRGSGSGQQARATSKTPLAIDAWTHLAYVVDRANRLVRCYLDGEPSGTTPIPETLDDATFDVGGTDLRIPSSHKPFSGLFDELKVHHRALAEEEIRASHDADKGNRASVACEQ